MKSLASDNYSGVSPEILQAIIEANHDHVPAYGNDPYTEKAISLFKNLFGESSSIYFVSNGTAANTLGLKTVTRSHHAIICSESAHIACQEVGAPTHAIGCMLLPVSHQQGKITPSAIEETYHQAVYWGRHANLYYLKCVFSRRNSYPTLNNLCGIKTPSKQMLCARNSPRA